MTRKKSYKKKRDEPNYNGIVSILLTLALVYIVITNWTLIMVGGIITIFLLVIIVAVAAYFILPRVGVTALTGLFGALAALISATKRKG